MTTTAEVRAEIEAEIRAEREAEIERRVAARQNAEEQEAAREAEVAEVKKLLSTASRDLIAAQEQILDLMPQITSAIKQGRDIRDSYDALVRRARRLGISVTPVPEIGVQAAHGTSEDRRNLRTLVAEFKSVATAWVLP